MTRLDQNRAAGQIAEKVELYRTLFPATIILPKIFSLPNNFGLKHDRLNIQLGVPISAVKKVTIWGNHSSTQFPDAAHATVNGNSALSITHPPDDMSS